MENKMKILFAIAFVAIVIAAGTASAQDDVTKEITVSGETGLKWMNTGLFVSLGDMVRLEAKGQVDVGGTWGIHGPDGTTKFSEQPRVIRSNRNCVTASQHV